MSSEPHPMLVATVPRQSMSTLKDYPKKISVRYKGSEASIDLALEGL